MISTKLIQFLTAHAQVPQTAETGAPSGGKMCYDCGYLIDGWTQDGLNYQHPMTDGTPMVQNWTDGLETVLKHSSYIQCGDEATLEGHVTSCSDEGECCGVVREFYVQ